MDVMRAERLQLVERAPALDTSEATLLVQLKQATEKTVLSSSRCPK